MGGLVVALAAYALLPSFVRIAEASPALPEGAGLEVAAWGEQGAWFLHYVHGGTVTVRVPVHNRSALPLTVDSVQVPARARPLVTTTATSTPGTVPPFATRDVTLTFRYGNCRYYHERAAQTVDRLAVRGHTLGRSVIGELVLAEPLVVHGQVISDCPDRTLVRGDDRR